MALFLISFDITQPTPAVPTGTIEVVVGGTEGDPIGYVVPRVPGGAGDMTLGADNTASFALSGIAPGRGYSGACAPDVPGRSDTVSLSFDINEPDAPRLGCMAPNALNFDPAATQDDTLSLCVFVNVVAAPYELVAAHLPIPVVLCAAPTLAGLASIVVLYLETAASPAGPWQEFGRLRQVCDTEATVRFDLSEAAKSLLRLGPPVETGTDTGLSALLRARYEVLDPVTLNAAYAGEVGSCRVLNAVVQPGSNVLLTTKPVYDEIPEAGNLWRTVATYVGGVVSAPVLVNRTGCPARQFAWLNATGAWDTGFFAGRHIHGTDQADPITFRDLAGAGRYAKRGTVRPTLQVYSDKVDWPTFQLLRGVRDSVQVWERVGPGQYVPVLVATESYQEYQEQTDKTYQVNFTVSYPAQLIQTQ